MFLSLFTIQNDTLSALHTSCCNPPALITTQLLFLSLFLTLWCFCMDCSSSLNPHSVTVAVSTLVSLLRCFALWCEDRCRSASAPALGTVLSPSLPSQFQHETLKQDKPSGKGRTIDDTREIGLECFPGL